MKTIVVFLFSFAVFSCAYAQQLICEIQFNYDAAGNRVSRDEVCYTPKTSFIPEETVESPDMAQVSAFVLSAA